MNHLRKRAVRAIWWGVAAAALASVATAIALNMLIVSAPGAARETLEGAVMLVAAGVLFYVSYWLDFAIRSQAMDGLSWPSARAEASSSGGRARWHSRRSWLSIAKGPRRRCCIRPCWEARGGRGWASWAWRPAWCSGRSFWR